MDPAAAIRCVLTPMNTSTDPDPPTRHRPLGHNAPPPTARHWRGEIVQRFQTLWLLKAIGTSTFMALFFWAYFTILEHPSRPPIVMPTLFIDDWVAMVPWSFAVYVSLWVYVSLAPALMPSFRALVWYGVWICGLCVFCLVIFWVLPTQTPHFDVDWSLHPGLSLIKGVDAAGNACPSLHVASAVFTGFWLHAIFVRIGAPIWLRSVNALQCVAIAWSTLATLQHVAWDVLAGAALGALFAWASLKAAGSGARPVPI